jgi:hypothetical protein
MVWPFARPYLVVEHIEKYWCPSISSADVISLSNSKLEQIPVIWTYSRHV